MKIDFNEVPKLVLVWETPIWESFAKDLGLLNFSYIAPIAETSIVEL